MQKMGITYDKRPKKWALKLLALFYTLINVIFRSTTNKIREIKRLTTKLGSFIFIVRFRSKSQNKKMQKMAITYDKKPKKWALKLLALFYTLINVTFKSTTNKIREIKRLTTKLGSFISLVRFRSKSQNKKI